MFCVVFAYTTEYEQMVGGEGGGGGQKFIGPRGIKYLNTVLATASCMIP
jgi:hypothetical protein